jgi:restriction system protein
MAIPSVRTILLPLLKLAENGEEICLQKAVEKLAIYFNLTEEEKNRRFNSNHPRTMFYYRVGWAKSDLKLSLLAEYTRRGCFKITEAGLNILKSNPQRIDRAFLARNSEINLSNENEESENVVDAMSSEQPPNETIDTAFKIIKQTLAADIVEKIKECPPVFFERLVVDVLVKMGYGGTREDAGEIIGKSGDEGIDGIIKEDRLGLDVIYIQAKRWKDNVGRPEIQKFAGALQGQRARKGVFITTSDFTKDAKEYVSRIDSKIILIDGMTLAHLMIEYNVGVSTVDVYEIKKIDSDYFNDEL